MPLIVLFTSMSGFIGKNGPCCGEPLCLRAIYFAIISSGSPVIIIFSALTMFTFLPPRRWRATTDAVLPRTRFLPSMFISSILHHDFKFYIIFYQLVQRQAFASCFFYLFLCLFGK